MTGPALSSPKRELAVLVGDESTTLVANGYAVDYSWPS